MLTGYRCNQGEGGGLGAATYCDKNNNNSTCKIINVLCFGCLVCTGITVYSHITVIALTHSLHHIQIKFAVNVWGQF